MNLNQVTVGALDFEASLAFYHALGLKLIVLAEGRYARFELPSGDATFSIDHDPGHKAGSNTIYFEVADLDARHAELVALGIEFVSGPRDEPWLWREARFRDPSGNRLCLFQAGSNRRFPPWRLETSEAD